MRKRDVVRKVANILNGSSFAGNALAKARGCEMVDGPRGITIATGYPRAFPAPHAGAVTVGDVVLFRGSPAQLIGKEALIRHEYMHCTQWAACGGIVGFIPAYFAASLWSYIRRRDYYTFNIFEQHAGLEDGGYVQRTPLR